MKKVIALGILVLLLFLPSLARGDELEDLEKQLQDTRSQIQSSEQKLNSTKSALQEAKSQEQYFRGALNTLAGRLAHAKWQLEQTDLELEEKDLELEQTDNKVKETELQVAYRKKLLTRIVRNFYITSFVDEVSFLLSDAKQGSLAQALAYRQSVTFHYRDNFETITGQLHELEVQKKELEVKKEELAQAKKDLETQRVTIQNQINYASGALGSAQARQQDLAASLTGLETALSSLTQKEQEILRAKAAAALASTSVGNQEISKAAIEADPPGTGYFSFWTYGYPHQVGMSQYGAYGRSKAGQNASQILRTYFSGVAVETKNDLPEKITIQTGNGTQELLLEDEYLKGIGEMPSCWGTPDNKGLEALKAQVIASRSYALSYTNMGSQPICITQACQVYVGSSKVSGACGEYWAQAVDETKGQVVTHGGSIIPAWYASTAGGFTRSSQDVWGSARPYAQGIADLDELSFPYDGPKWGNSPWYHKAWGNQPWLSGGQVADLFNAALLPTSYNSNVPSEANGGFSVSQVRETLQKEGIAPVDNVTAVEVFGQNSAKTNTVRVYYGNGQSREVDAQRFRFVYNLRSPGTNAIWTPRFDVVTS